MNGRIIHTGQVVIDLTVHVDNLPEPGGDVFAEEAVTEVGGGFNVMSAARQLGIETVYAGALGTGPFSDMAEARLAEIGVAHMGCRVEGDLGYCLAITDRNAERTFVSTRGAEAKNPIWAFDPLNIGDDDVLYISGYSFAHSANTAALMRLARRISEESIRCTVLFDASPMVYEIPEAALNMIQHLNVIWSLNEREAVLLAKRLGIQSGVDHSATCAALSSCLGSVLLRAGSEGSWYCDGGKQEMLRTPSIPVDAIDSNGAGDAHAGVLAAALARGIDLPTALRWANVAGALATTQRGPATCPTEREIRALA